MEVKHTVKELLESVAKNAKTYGTQGFSPDQALKEIEAIHQQEIAKARLNEVQNAYEYWINDKKFISSYFRDRIAELSSSKESTDNE